MSLIQRLDVTIPAGTGGSAMVNLSEVEVKAIYLPATFTSTALTLTAASRESETYRAVKDSSGAAISITVANSTMVVLTEAQKIALDSLTFVKFVNGTSEGADRTITLLLKPF